MQKKDKRDQIFEVRLTKADVNWLEKHRRRKKYLGADVGELIQNLINREFARAKPMPAPKTPSDFKMPCRRSLMPSTGCRLLVQVSDPFLIGPFNLLL